MLKLTFVDEDQEYEVEMSSGGKTFKCLCEHKTCDFILPVPVPESPYTFKAKSRCQNPDYHTVTFHSNDTWIDKSQAGDLKCLKNEIVIVEVIDQSRNLVKFQLRLNNMARPPAFKGKKLLKFYLNSTTGDCGVTRTFNLTLYRMNNRSRRVTRSCLSLDQLAEVDLSKYLNRLHKTPLPVDMSIDSLDIPLEVLAPDVYLLCFYLT